VKLKNKIYKKAKDNNKKSEKWRLILKYPQQIGLPWDFNCQAW
jgi:hypothetical protein